MIPKPKGPALLFIFRIPHRCDGREVREKQKDKAIVTLKMDITNLAYMWAEFLKAGDARSHILSIFVYAIF